MKKFHCLKISIVIALLITSMLLASCSGSTSNSSNGSESGVNVTETSSYVDLLDYIQIEETGVQGHGSINVSNKLHMEEFKDSDEFTVESLSKKYNINETHAENLLEFLDTMDIDSDNTSDKNNGDIVEITITNDEIPIDSLYFIDTRNTTYEYTFSSLPEVLDELNPFDYLTVSFSGSDGLGSVELEIKEYEPYSSEFHFEATYGNGEEARRLSNGDIIYVTCEPPGVTVKKYTQTRKKYTVSGLGDRITTLDDTILDNLDTSEIDEFSKYCILEYNAGNIDTSDSENIYDENCTPSGSVTKNSVLTVTTANPICAKIIRYNVGSFGMSDLYYSYSVFYKCNVQVSDENGNFVDNAIAFVEYSDKDPINYNGKLNKPNLDENQEAEIMQGGSSPISLISLPADVQNYEDATEYIISSYGNTDIVKVF